MRESIGAGWLMTIVISFIILFSGFLALSINYSKAFRIKDGIVDRIEKHNGLCHYNSNTKTTAKKDIDDYIDKIGYASRGKCPDGYTYGVNKNANVVKLISENNKQTFNYCVARYDAKSETDSNVIIGSYYKVAVFFSISLPIFQSSNLFMVTGETISSNFPVDDISHCA